MRYRTQLPNEYKYVILVIRNTFHNQLSGSIYHSATEEKLPFDGFISMAEKMEKISDSVTYPSVCMERRSFFSEKNLSELDELENLVDRVEERMRSTKPLASYRLQLLHRLRSTWQGNLQDRETGEIWKFESFLDLIRILEKHMNISLEQSPIPQLSNGIYLFQEKNQKFSLNILYQRNGTWQGTLQWLSAKKSLNFRSFLELLLILQEVLNKEKISVIRLNEYESLVRSG